MDMRSKINFAKNCHASTGFYGTSGLIAQNNFIPTRILDVRAWNGFSTNNVKKICTHAHYTCIEAGPKHEYELKKCADKVLTTDIYNLI